MSATFHPAAPGMIAHFIHDDESLVQRPVIGYLHEVQQLSPRDDSDFHDIQAVIVLAEGVACSVRDENGTGEDNLNFVCVLPAGEVPTAAQLADTRERMERAASR